MLGQKIGSRLCIYPVCQIFCQNHFLLLHFQDKCIFAVYAEIQDGPQKWQENNFGEKSLADSGDTLWVKKFHRNCSILLCFRDKRVFSFLKQKFDMASKSRGKTKFEKGRQ